MPLAKNSVYLFVFTFILISLSVLFLRINISSYLPQVIVNMSLGSEQKKLQHRTEVFVNKNFLNSYFINSGLTNSAVKLNITENNISYLRLDPTDVGDTVFTLRSVIIVFKNVVIAEFTPKQILKWKMTGVKIIEATDEAISFLSINNDPMIVFEPQRPIHIYDDGFWGKVQISFFQMLKLAQSNYLIVFFAILSIFVTLFFILCDKKLAFSLICSFAIIYIIFLLNYYFSARNIHDVSVAVGYSVYHNYNKTLYNMLHLLILVMPVFLGIFALIFKSKSSNSIDTTSYETAYQSDESKKLNFSLLILFGFIFSCILFYMPNMSYVQHHFSNLELNLSNWDAENIVTWQYFYMIGLEPFKEFWYPYAGYFLGLTTNQAPVVTFFQNSLNFYLISISLYAIFKGHKFLLFLTLVCIFVISNSIGYNFRYVLSFLAFYAAYLAHDNSYLRHVNFTLASFLLVFYEPTAIVYVGFPLFIYLFITAFEGGYSKNALQVLWKDVKKCLPPAIVIGIFLIYIVLSGYYTPLLATYMDFQKSMSAFSTYGNLEKWIFFEPSFEVFVIWGSTIFASIATYNILIQKNSSNLDAKLYSLIFLCSFSSLVLLTKFFVRPHIANQMIGLVCIVSVLYIVIVLNTFFLQKKNKTYSLILACLTTFIFLGFYGNNFLSRIYASVKILPQNICANFDFSVPKHIKELYREALFKKDRKYALLASAISEIGQDSSYLYVLGDDPYAFIATDKKPLLYVEMYNQSVFNVQNNIINTLKNIQPLVIYTKARLGIDDLPIVVRNPRIVEYIACNYFIVKELDDYIIFKHMTGDIFPDISGLTNVFGNIIDFKFIPLHSLYSGAQKAPILPLGAKVERLLEIKIKNMHNDLREVECNFKISGENYVVKMSVVNEVDTYNIPLKNIWFLAFAKKYNLPISIEKSDIFDISFVSAIGKNTLY